uniref:Uncharacterized protein n=1 Tax=Anguilla anguilla TaxID=7936 RepID=A0A0E9X4N5_ANGAN
MSDTVETVAFKCSSVFYFLLFVLYRTVCMCKQSTLFLENTAELDRKEGFMKRWHVVMFLACLICPLCGGGGGLYGLPSSWLLCSPCPHCPSLWSLHISGCSPGRSGLGSEGS